MKKNELKNLIQKITLKGGLTLKSNEKELDALSGFMVSLAGYESKLSLDNVSIEIVNDYLQKARKMTKNIKHNVYVGFWIDNNILYLDLSIKIDNKQLALSVARKNNQIAIFDLENQISLYL